MPSINQRILGPLIKLIRDFIERKTGTFLSSDRNNAELVHYYKEIVRNWNKINFIFKRKLKSSKKLINFKKINMAKFFIAIYLIVWEKQDTLKVGTELNFSSATTDLFKKLKFFSWDKELSSKDEIERLSLQLAVPSFMINRLVSTMDTDSIRANINYMDRQKERTTFFFRINNLIFDNTQKVADDLIIGELKEQGVDVSQDSHFSNLYLAESKNKRKLLVSRFYKEKKIVIQDKASYAVAQILNPQENELIFDMCAAPGIKTSIISQLSQNNSRILANDFSMTRVNTLNQFLKSLNVKNTHLINSDGIAFPLRFNNFFDKILLDAPCTGSGTFSTNPELKWRQNEGFLHQNLILQEKLLNNAINLLKPSGILVYSTCSLYPEEGELQVLKIMDRCKPIELPKWYSPSYKINEQHVSGAGRLFPAIHHTKGFFIAKFIKK